MKTSITLTGFDSFQEKLKNLERQIRMDIESLLHTLANRLIGIVKLNTPVDTGFLRHSWDISDIETEPDGAFIIVFNTAEYASDVEFGHIQRSRWVPGEWAGNRFKYKPGAKTGMMLSTKFIPGKFMLKISTNQLENEIPAELKDWFKSEIIAWWEK